jgi:prophage regulatory protein
MRFLYPEDLRARGIKYSRQHLHRLIKAGIFPAPIKPGTGGHNAWLESEIEAYQQGRVAERDARLSNEEARPPP